MKLLQNKKGLVTLWSKVEIGEGQENQSLSTSSNTEALSQKETSSLQNKGAGWTEHPTFLWKPVPTRPWKGTSVESHKTQPKEMKVTEKPDDKPAWLHSMSPLHYKAPGSFACVVEWNHACQSPGLLLAVSHKFWDPAKLSPVAWKEILNSSLQPSLL